MVAECGPGGCYGFWSARAFLKCLKPVLVLVNMNYGFCFSVCVWEVDRGISTPGFHGKLWVNIASTYSHTYTVMTKTMDLVSHLYQSTANIKHQAENNDDRFQTASNETRAA